ncbi:hypothetical protein WI604_30395 [Bradyrhizobium symbiodeficiens]|uniref:hypothetical protein n=1 Tax=Bradyrhizobium symbiodeficiens TaxID=1404367 RepID=UPI0030CEE5C2
MAITAVIVCESGPIFQRRMRSGRAGCGLRDASVKPGHDKKEAAKDAPKPAVAAAKPADPAKPDTPLAQTLPALKPSVSDGAGEVTQIVGPDWFPTRIRSAFRCAGLHRAVTPL